jgi:hypothetical protein
LAFLLGPVSTDGPQFTRSIAKLHPLSGGLIQVVEGLGAERNGVFISACPALFRPVRHYFGLSGKGCAAKAFFLGVESAATRPAIGCGERD